MESTIVRDLSRPQDGDTARPVPSLVHDVADSIDRLITTDVCAPYIIRDNIVPLYGAARKQIGKPLTLAAAEGLRAVCAKDSVVVISSGFVVLPFLPHGETDGPIGAVALARAINKAFGCQIVLLTEEACIPSLRATCAGAGVLPLDPDVAGSVPSSVTLLPFPLDVREAERESERILQTYDPSAIITVERSGRNAKGVYHTSPGGDMSGSTAKVDLLFDRMRQDGRLTIGIGDYGNEIGLGSLIETVRQIGPSATRCTCPCGSGMATIVEAQIPMVASISNWGASGIIAALATLLGDPSILHDSSTERRMIEQCCLSGSCDGVTVKPSFSVDGVSIEGHAAMNTLLHQVISAKTTYHPFIRT